MFRKYRKKWLRINSQSVHGLEKRVLPRCWCDVIYLELLAKTFSRHGAASSGPSEQFEAVYLERPRPVARPTFRDIVIIFKSSSKMIIDYAWPFILNRLSDTKIGLHSIIGRCMIVIAIGLSAIFSKGAQNGKPHCFTFSRL